MQHFILIFASALFFHASLSYAQGSQDSTNLGGISLPAQGVRNEFQSVACDPGYAGEITYQRWVVGSTPTVWREVGRSCREGFYMVENIETRTMSCPSGYAGSELQSRAVTQQVSMLTGVHTPFQTYPWQTQSSTCVLVPPPPPGCGATISATWYGADGSVCIANKQYPYIAPPNSVFDAGSVIGENGATGRGIVWANCQEQGSPGNWQWNVNPYLYSQYGAPAATCSY